MDKKGLIGSQITIVLWLLVAAISSIETYKQYLKGGFSNIWVYVLAVVFFVSAYMYFKKKKERFSQKK